MSWSEGRSIYPVLAALEVLAVELQQKPPPELLERLRQQNAELAASTSDPELAFALDRRWHETLVSRCGNDLLIEHLRSLRTQAERYDRAYMKYSGIVPMSADDHGRIIDALARDPRGVAPLIRRNWQRSVEFLREWLVDAGHGMGVA
jgi:DNA-binding GntR family transcriptional regulator